MHNGFPNTADALAARPWLRVVEAVESGGEVVGAIVGHHPLHHGACLYPLAWAILPGASLDGKIATDLIEP